MRNKLIVFFALILAAFGAALGSAQVATTPFTAPIFYASSFGLWSINSQAPNTFVFQGRTLCNGAGQNVNFFDFATNAPVWIADSNTANSEVKTPSAIVQTAGTCGVTIAPSNSHYSFQLKSGTAGLLEAINTVKASGGIPATVALDRNWWTQANQVPGTSGASIIAAATGGPGVILQDITTVPNAFYVWTGSAYAVTYPYWSNTAPTLAAGAAAGSSPTVSVKAGSTQLSGVVNVTTGTATTTGALFTLTFPQQNAGGFGYAGTCTVSSVGTNAFTTFTEATSTTGSAGTTLQRVSTVTVTATPTVSTAYQFSYNCQ
jgi:hypothetical protein